MRTLLRFHFLRSGPGARWDEALRCLRRYLFGVWILSSCFLRHLLRRDALRYGRDAPRDVALC